MMRHCAKRELSWNSKTVETHFLQRNTEDRLILDGLLFSSVKEMWLLAVCFQLMGVVK